MLKINVGFNRKVGEANYGSGARASIWNSNSTPASWVSPNGSRIAFGNCSASQGVGR